MEILENINLKPLNTFGISVTTKFFTSIKSESELQEVLNHKAYINEARLALGGGSNLLFTKNFHGLTLKMDLAGIELVKETESHYFIEVGAGQNWHEFVMHCVNNNWPGLENLSLIPGNVGAAPMQNIGAYGVESKMVIDWVRAYLPEEKKFETFTNNDCEFGYRSSIFKTRLKNRAYITKVGFKLNKNQTLNTSYGAIESQLEKLNISSPTLKNVSDAVIAIRQSKLPDPLKIGNAGSFFKNPVVPKELAKKIKSKHPESPQYEVSSSEVKIPAGWLIEQAGWKGKTFNDCFGVHKNQALVLVNYGNATGGQIFDLSENIIEDIETKFGVELEREVNVI